MKEFLLVIVVAILGPGMTHAIEPKYKDYVEPDSRPLNNADLGFMYVTSPTHGFKLLDVGLGAEVVR